MREANPSAGSLGNCTFPKNPDCCSLPLHPFRVLVTMRIIAEGAVLKLGKKRSASPGKPICASRFGRVSSGPPGNNRRTPDWRFHGEEIAFIPSSVSCNRELKGNRPLFPQGFSPQFMQSLKIAQTDLLDGRIDSSIVPPIVEQTHSSRSSSWLRGGYIN